MGNTILDGVSAADPQALFRKVEFALVSEEFRVLAATHSNSRRFVAGLLQRKAQSDTKRAECTG